MRYATAAGPIASALVLSGPVLAGCQADPEITAPGPTSPARVEHDLLTIVNQPRSDLTDRQKAILAATLEHTSHDYWIETTFARVSPDVEAFYEVGFELGIELSDTAYYVATATDVGEDIIEGETNTWWEGKLSDRFGELGFTINSKVGISGSVVDHTNGKLYDFRSLGDDLVAIARLDPTKLGPIDSEIHLTTQELR